MSQEKMINKKKLIGIAGLVVAVILCGGLWWWINYAGVVSTDDARVKGTIVAVSSRVSAQVDEVLVNEGDEVQAGQIIAKLDSKELEAQVAQASANLTAAQAKLAGIKVGNRPQQIAQAEAGAEQAAANLENAQKIYERSETLYNEGAISAQQLDSASTALSVAQAQYHAAGQSVSLTAEGARPEDIQAAAAQVEQAAAALKNAELQLNNTVIKAPISGVVAVKSVDAGESISVGQALVNIANLNDIWVAANIDETNVGKMRVGQNVEFSIDAYPGRTFSGEVSEIGAATGSQFALLPTENTSGNYTKVTQKLPIKIKVNPNDSYSLKPGMSAIVNVHVS
jgi:ABC exporter DevB family membrane fusion protein